MENVHVLVINGAVGVGKTSVAHVLSDILSENSIHHAVIDLDALRYAFPRPPEDQFHMVLGYKNLSAIWKNYRELDIQYFIIPNVVEDLSEVGHIEQAIPGANVTVVRLTAPVPTIHNRLREREKSEKSLNWHLNRAVELSAHLEKMKVEDVVINTENKSVDEVAKEILIKVEWLPQPA